MSKLGENLHQQYHPSSKIQQKPTKNTIRKKPLKITYISSPVLVRATTASEFRNIVQELTGKDSDVGVLSPHDDDGRLILTPGGTADLLADRSGSAADFLSDEKYPYVEEGVDFSENSGAVRGFGFQESFLWRESTFPGGMVAGVQSPHCFLK